MRRTMLMERDSEAAVLTGGISGRGGEGRSGEGRGAGAGGRGAGAEECEVGAGRPRVEATRVASALDLLDGSSASLVEASHAVTVAQRYVTAQLAALRAAAAVLAIRGPRLVGSGSSGGPRNLWELLPAVAPELREWSDFFARSAARRWAIDEGRVAVSAREADDLVRSAQEFHDRVRGLLGLTRIREPLRLAPAVLP